LEQGILKIGDTDSKERSDRMNKVSEERKGKYRRGKRKGRRKE
jgi:hypothetical protein